MRFLPLFYIAGQQKAVTRHPNNPPSYNACERNFCKIYYLRAFGDVTRPRTKPHNVPSPIRVGEVILSGRAFTSTAYSYPFLAYSLPTLPRYQIK